MPRRSIDKINLFWEFARQILNQNKNISAAAVNRMFKERYGEGLNKSKYLEIVREIKQQAKSMKKYQAGMKGGRPKKRDRDVTEIEKTSGHQLRKYHYFVSFKAYDNVEGKEYKDYITVSSNKKLTKERVEEIAKQILEENNLMYRSERKVLIDTINVEYVSVAVGKTKILLR